MPEFYCNIYYDFPIHQEMFNSDNFDELALDNLSKQDFFVAKRYAIDKFAKEYQGIMGIKREGLRIECEEM